MCLLNYVINLNFFQLCQFMLEQEIFQVVKGHKSDDKALMFEDSQGKLYRFLSDKENTTDNMRCHSCQELSKPDLVTRCGLHLIDLIIQWITEIISF